MDKAITRVTPGQLTLDDGRKLPYHFVAILPRMRGIDGVHVAEAITAPSGFVRVDPQYCTEAYPKVCTADIAVFIPPPKRAARTVCRTGYLSDEMVRVVAYDITAKIHGR